MKNVRAIPETLTKAGLAFLLVLLFAQTSGQAQPVSGPLPYSRGFLVTGNYVVSGIDLTESRNPPDMAGMSSGVIHMAGTTAVPADADIVGAYLFWETITLTSTPSQAQVKFRDQSIDLADANIVALKDAPLSLVGSSSTCWSSGVPLTSHMFRADVLSMLPLRLDKDGRNTGKRLVNDADLTAGGFGLNTVSLPTRSGNQIPESAGASFVVVYRDDSEPLRKIMIYDNANVALPSIDVAMEQTIAGFYKSSATQSAKITHIVASGQPNNNDKITFTAGTTTTTLVSNAFGTGSLELTDPNDLTSFSEGGASQRAWGNPTRVVTDFATLTPGVGSNTTFGETYTTSVVHSPANGGQDCLTWGAVIFSISVADVDGDGLPDGLEDATVQMKDPDGVDLPRLNQMLASSSHPDLFVEVNGMWAQAGTVYGSADAPINPTPGPPTATDANGHVHLPTPADLKLIGDAYLAKGIHVHFDIGDTALGSYYRNLGVIQHTDWEDDYTSPAADAYLITVGAKGGELIKERACDETTSTCQFPDYPGTVGWKFGLQAYRDGAVGNSGEELFTPADLTAWTAGSVHRRRFDRVRRDLFHYSLWAHARGRPRDPLPCLVDGQPAPYPPSSTSCAAGTDNPRFHVPSTVSGIGDQPGGNILVSLGLWDEFVGRPYVRAATLFHELGHNGNLWHGGLPAILGNNAVAVNTATYIEPNCKPFYRSSMNYLYELHGLFDYSGNLRLDYSSVAPAAIKETDTLLDNPVSPPGDYQVAWYAPAGSALATELGISAATRFCNGPKFGPTPPASMARVHTRLTLLDVGFPEKVDWNGDKLQAPCPVSAPACDRNLPLQDINFDNVVTGPTNSLYGFDDWAALRLDQIGAGHSFRFSGASSDTGVSEGDTGQSESDTGVSESDTGMAEGDTGNSESDTGQSESDTGVSESDLFIGAEQPVTLEGANGAGRPRPFDLTACITENGDPTGCKAGLPADPPNHRIKLKWKASNFGTALYLVERKRGDAASTNPFVQIGTATGNYFVDVELPNTIQFTYRVRARFDDDPPADYSDYSNTVTETAVNLPPDAVANVYNSVPKNNFNVLVPGVLGNDTDVDSLPASFRAVKYTQTLPTGCTTGTLTLNANGSFTYKSKGNATQDVCWYVANNGFWSVDPTVPMSANSTPTTITFNIQQ
jgi:Bacterial cadherin-like domain